MGVPDSGRVPTDDARLAFALAASLLVGEAVVSARRDQSADRPCDVGRHLVDVNSASAGEMEALPGVGRVLAERIVAERAAADFASVEDLSRVPGVGPTTLERMRPFVRCGR